MAGPGRGQLAVSVTLPLLIRNGLIAGLECPGPDQADAGLLIFRVKLSLDFLSFFFLRFSFRVSLLTFWFSRLSFCLFPFSTITPPLLAGLRWHCPHPLFRTWGGICNPSSQNHAQGIGHMQFITPGPDHHGCRGGVWEGRGKPVKKGLILE